MFIRRRIPVFRSFVSSWLAILLACPAAASWEVAERIIPEDPVELLQPAAVLDAVEVVRWSLRSLADLQEWKIADATVTEGPAGLVFRATGPQPYLERAVSLDAATIDAFLIESAPKTRLVAKVLWKRAGEFFEPARSAQSDRNTLGDYVAAPHEIAVAPVQDWSGRVVAVRFRLLARGKEDVSLAAIVAVRHRPNPTRWEEASRKPWKARLVSADVADVRVARLAPREQPIRHPVLNRARTQLRFAYGVQGHLTERVCFSARVPRREGAPINLFTSCVAPGETERWYPARVDLPGWAGGEEARLELEVEGDPGSALPLWAHPEILKPVARQKPNVVLISIDTLRADRLGIYGYRRQTSPHLDRWAREHAVIFDEAITAAPWTIPSHVSMLTGMSPLRHGVNYVHAAPASLMTLAELLRAAGYFPMAITGGGYLAPWVGLHQGFDRYLSWRRRQGPRGERELASNVDVARQWLQEAADRPAFLFFHTYEVHAPYIPRQPFFARFNESGGALPAGGIGPSAGMPSAETGFVTTQLTISGPKSKERPLGDGTLPTAALPLLDALYDSGVAYADQEIERLLATLRDLGLDRHTMVIVTSDHGESLGENGLAGHAYLSDVNLRVPLLLALPGGDHAGSTVHTQVRSVDIVPTVLDVVGLPQPAVVDGHSLLPLLSSEAPASRQAFSYAAQSNHGIALRLDDGLKYIFNNNAWPPVHGRERLLRIDHETGAEIEVAGDTAQKRQLRQVLLNHYATDGPPALAVSIVNRFAVELSGRVAAKSLRPMQVKAVEPPPGELRWQRRGVDFTVPPGRRLNLLLEGSLTGVLVVSLRADTAAGALHARERVGFEQMTGPVSLHLQTTIPAAPWTAGVLPSDGSGVELGWRGRAQEMRREPAGIPEEAREQLRALGYLQ